MTNEEFQSLHADVARLRKKRVQSAFGLIPASVNYLGSKLSGALSEADRGDVYALLVNECSKARNDRLYVEVLRRRARDLSNDPISHAGLAFRLALIDPTSREETLEIAEKALLMAKSQNRQIRYCATNMARIGLMLDEYGVVERALKELVGDAGSQRAEDTGYEFDFVDQLDIRRVDTKLLAAYRALA